LPVPLLTSAKAFGFLHSSTTKPKEFGCRLPS